MIPGSGIPWRRKWQPTPVFLPGESHGQRSLAGCSPRHCTRVDLATKQQLEGQAWGGGVRGTVYGTCQEKSGLSASHVAFPFLLKIDPNTLYIIQKFRSLVAAARTPSLGALIPHLPSQGLGPKEQWPGLGGYPPTLLALETASRGCGLFLGAPPPGPPHGKGQILESASSVPSKLPSGVKCKPLGCSDGLPGPGTRGFFFFSSSALPTPPHESWLLQMGSGKHHP